MKERTKYQERAIKNFYQNREAIAMQRAQELLTELYLSSGKKRAQYWKQLATHLESLGVKQDQIEHLIAQDNPELAAHVVERLATKGD